jgi:hypothetical protein
MRSGKARPDSAPGSPTPPRNAETRAALCEPNPTASQWTAAPPRPHSAQRRLEGPESVRSDLASEEAERIEDEHGEEAAAAFFNIATGQGTPLSMLVDPWLAEQGVSITEQTVSHHRVAVRSFLAWAGEETFVEQVTRRQAGKFVSHLLSPESGLKPKTAKRYASSLSSLWTWLEARGHRVQDNPWLRQGIAKRSKRG